MYLEIYRDVGINSAMMNFYDRSLFPILNSDPSTGDEARLKVSTLFIGDLSPSMIKPKFRRFKEWVSDGVDFPALGIERVYSQNSSPSSTAFIICLRVSFTPRSVYSSSSPLTSIRRSSTEAPDREMMSYPGYRGDIRSTASIDGSIRTTLPHSWRLRRSPYFFFVAPWSH